MAVGGSHIHNKGNGSNGGSTRGRSYGLMLMLAFGAALLGVMILHKLRERRIYNLIVKEKDNELISLHLLLQVPSSSPLSCMQIMIACHLLAMPRMVSLAICTYSI